MDNSFQPKITVFHCINTFPDGSSLSVSGSDNLKLKSFKLPCSSMVKDVYLLRAFEAGADAVVVFVCPEGQCRYIEGNIRARKRVDRVKKLLDEIEFDGRRLSLFNIASGDVAAVEQIIQKVLSGINDLGPNPAA